MERAGEKRGLGAWGKGEKRGGSFFKAKDFVRSRFLALVSPFPQYKFKRKENLYAVFVS